MFSYQPDLPPETPDTWTVCDGFHPDVYGNYRTGRLPATPTQFLPTTAVGASAAFQRGLCYQDATGTLGVLLLHNATGNQATPKTYVWTVAAGWNSRDAANSGKGLCALQVGNITLVGGTQTGLVQRDATTTNNFAAVAGAPASVGVLAVGALNIVLALDTASDAYATSDTAAPTTWTGGESSSGNVRLTPGAFTAGVALGNDFICFKQRGVYRAQYVGFNQKWQFTLIDPEKGAWGRGCAVACDDRVIFIGNQGVYSYDGAQFQRLDGGIWRAIVSKLALYTGSFGDGDYDATQLIWDAINQNVLFFNLGNPVLTPGRELPANIFFSYNVVSKKWGYQSQLSETGSSNVIDAVFDISLANVPNGTSGAGSFGFNTNVGFYSTTNDKIQVLTTSFNASDLPGTNYKPKLRTFRIGERNKMTEVRRCTPLWTKADGAGTDLSSATVKTISPFSSSTPMATESAENVATMDSTYFRGDYLLSRVFQSAEISINCEAVISGATFDAFPAGSI